MQAIVELKLKTLDGSTFLSLLDSQHGFESLIYERLKIYELVFHKSSMVTSSHAEQRYVANVLISFGSEAAGGFDSVHSQLHSSEQNPRLLSQTRMSNEG